jgi:hypothetical protein
VASPLYRIPAKINLIKTQAARNCHRESSAHSSVGLNSPMSPGPNPELPAEPLSSLGSLLRITVSRQRDVHLAYVRPAGRDIRRRKGPNTLVASGLRRTQFVLKPVIHELARSLVTARAVAVMAYKIRHLSEVDPNQPTRARETEADVERTSEKDIAGNAQHGLTRLVPCQWHHQFRTEGLLYLALAHTPACALPTEDVPLGRLRCSDRDANDESEREPSEPLSIHVDEPFMTSAARRVFTVFEHGANTTR